MSLIKLLPENLVNQIAAGEVVERPASVVKELVENSIDAGGDRIVVDVKNAGRTFIKVADNGVGMSKEDCEMALERHATSKINNENDLWKIKTMGFRGEALASIASVSKLTLKSKKADDIAGTEIECDGGDFVTIKDVGMSDGTQVQVHNLFFNTPARQKYLKKESTELSHITNILNKIALANPSIALKLIHNDKVVFDWQKSNDLLSRIGEVFGRATADAMLPLYYGGSDFKMDGFVGKPVLARSSSKYQYFFVNGRAVQHYLFANTITNAFHSMLMERKRPIFFINIHIDPALIDVNVHPRKIEIRFEDEQTILKVLYGATKKALESNNLMPKGFSESQRYMSDNLPQSFRNKAPQDSKINKSIFHNKKSTNDMDSVQGAMSFSKSVLEEKRDFKGVDISRTNEINDQKTSIEPIGQVLNSYIIAKNDQGLVLIDQHAAHERVRYDELMTQYENQKKSVQQLLVPQQLELSYDEIQILKDQNDLFTKLGFEIEPFGGKTFVIQSVPSCLAKEDMHEIIKGVLDDIDQGKKANNMQGKQEEILTYFSCRSAIKFGQKLELPEMQALVNQLNKISRPFTCPHGRPTMVSLTLDELGRMFGRK
ncbi:DNA mismatch repair endonuclease MutL [Patescibacteria group bacterium]